MLDWRHGRTVAVLCLVLLAVVALRLANLASHAAPATRDAQLSTYGTTHAETLPQAPATP